MTTKKKWYHHPLFPGSRPALLLVSLFLLLAIFPQFEQGLNASHSEHRLAGLMLHVFFTLILIGSAWIVHDRRRSFIIACVLASPWVILGWLDHFLDFSDPTEGVITLLFAVATLYVTLLQIGFILRAKKIDADLLCRAVAVYLMLGVVWMALYGAVELFNPFSFQADPAALHGAMENGVQRLGASDLLYYSFSTLSTLGMGDITPISPLARSLTLLECVIGPMYMALLLARLVAVYGREK
jgi:voltage-gated potassium channel